METVKKKTYWIQLVTFTIIAVLVVEDGLLIIQNKELKARLNAFAAPQMEPLKPGEVLQPVNVQTLDGNIRELNYSDTSKKYLLFVFSTTCPHCERNLVRWQEIVDGYHADGCDIIGISVHDLDATQRYVTTKNIGFVTVSSAKDTSFARKYKMSGVPETILVAKNGKVEKTWRGELNAEQTDEIKSLIGSRDGTN